MRLNEISDRPEARQARKRLGRGIGSGTGKTAARGHKGQKSRSGVSFLGFEGGQMPLHRRMPKAGFTNIFRKNFRVVNLGRLQQAVDAGKLDAAKPVTESVLVEAGVIKSVRDGVRVLAKGVFSAKLAIQVTGASTAAIEAIEGSGGSITIASRKEKNVKRKEKNAKPTKKTKVAVEETSDADGAGDAASDKE